MLSPLKKMTKEELAQWAKAGKAHLKAQQEDVLPPLLEYQYDLTDAIIVDVDQTLFLKSPDRGVYDFTKCENDIPIKGTIALVKAMAHTAKIIIVTGREEVFRNVTHQLLIKHGIHYHKLLMKPTGDNKPVGIVKDRLYVDNILRKYNTLFVLEDDEESIKAYRKLGLFVLKVPQT